MTHPPMPAVTRRRWRLNGPLMPRHSTTWIWRGGTVSTRLWGSYIDERYGEEGVLNYDDDLIPDQTLLNASVAYRPGGRQLGSVGMGS